MRFHYLRLTAVVVGLLLVATAGAQDDITISYQEPLEQLRLAYASSFAEQEIGAGTARSLRFDAFGKHFDINLEVNRTLLDAKQRDLLDARYEIYRGDITAMPNSWARLVIADNVPRGMLWDGAELWAIEVTTNKATGAEEPFMFRLKDVHIAPGSMACSELSAATNGGEFAKAVMSEVTASAAQGPGAVSQIDLAVIADFEFTNDKGSQTNAALTTRMNNVDGIFSMQLGVQINVNRIDTFTSNNDPFTDQLDSGTLLDELTDYRADTSAQNANGLSHLFTGRNLDGATVGIAYSSALCSRRYGAGLTEGTHSATMDSLIAAHELGHNFGAPHDGTSGSACESESGDFLMAPSLNGSDEFSSCSIMQMQDDVANASCITPLLVSDAEVFSGGQSANTLLGDVAAITFDVNSVGSGTVNGVNVDVSIPAGASVASVSATSGSCSSGAGSASCAIGSVAAGSGVTVTINANTLAVGVVDFVASVTADSDGNGANDQATEQLTIDPAVDLISTATNAQVVLNQSTTLRPTIENRSSIAATDVVATLTLNSNIRADSASWPVGSCSIDAQVVTCLADSLAAQSINTLQLGVSGMAEGNQFYSVAVSAAETDRNTTNNDASGELNVTAAPSSGGSGGGASSDGGGSLSWLSLLGLLLVAMRPSRRIKI
jgi:hypothetical protein